MNDAPIASYSFCRSVVEQEQRYTLYPDRLVVDGHDSRAQTYPLSEIQRVHLKYEHTKQREYYQCFIHTKRGRIDLRHVHWSGFAKFEDRRATYAPFVKALLAAASRVQGVEFRAGSLVNYLAAIIAVPLMAGLAWLCVSLQRYGLAFVAAAMGGIALVMIGPSRPRRLDPLAPPADLLPEAR